MTSTRRPTSGAKGIFIITLFFYSFSCVFPYASWAQGKQTEKTPLSRDVASEDELLTDKQLIKERKIGRKAVEQIEERWELIADPARLVRLSMIVDKLKPHLEREIPYEVRIVRMDFPNAFCLPGGYIFFTSKMLELLHSDAEIAAIMAHEMIHVDQNHGLKMAAKSNKLSLAALAVILLSGGAIAPTVLAQVAQVAMGSAYTIEFEKESDSKGLDVLIAAGYSPTAMVTVMENFMHEEMKLPMREYGIYMDHPESVERVQSMSDRLKSLNIKLERKYPLQLLLTSIQEDRGNIMLFIDDVEVWRGIKSEAALKALEQAKKVLDANFQMELAPYDLQLENNHILRLKNMVLATAPLEGKTLEGKALEKEEMQSLSVFRENLLDALARAQKKHPIAKYFR